jgi:hypothetical protein
VFFHVTMLFIAPPLRRRRHDTSSKTSAFLHSASPPTASIMGNQFSLDPVFRAEVTNAALDVVASHPQHAQMVKRLLSDAPAAAACAAPSPPASTKAKHQCRWCTELFDRKANMQRHEKRKHAAELAKAAQATSTDAVQAGGISVPPERSGFKRSFSGLATDSESDCDPSPKRTKSEPSAVTVAVDCDSDMEVSELELGCEPGALEDPELEEEFEEQACATSPLHQQDKATEQADVDQPLKEEELFPEALRQEQEAANERISTAFSPFLLWLCSPAMTETERLVKARRMDPKGLEPVRKNLSFLVKLMLGTAIVELSEFKLESFAQEGPCQQLHAQLEERKVGASRIYTLFLLVKKVSPARSS